MSDLHRFVLTYILNSIWQVPLVAIVAVGCMALLRKGSFSIQHRLWVAALVAAFLLPLASASGWFTFLAHPASGHLRSKAAPTMTLFLDGESAVSSFGAHQSSSWFAASAANAVILIWMGFVLYRMASLAWGWRRTLTIVRGGRTAVLPDAIDELWKTSQARFGLTKSSLLISNQIATPATLGAKRPVVLLPSGLLLTASEHEFAAIFAHESAHIQRRDFLWNILYEVLAIPIVYHPMIRMLRSRIADSRELVCDELAANELGNTAVYARSLIRIAESLSSASAPAPALGIFEGHNLEKRVITLIDRGPRLSRLATVMIVTCCSMLFGASCLAASAFNFQPAAIVSEELKPFAGTWHWMFKGKPFITMVLVPEGDHFSGYTTNAFLRNDADGTMDAAPEPGISPIARTFFVGRVLHIVVHSDEWTMTLAGPDKAEFFMAEPDRPKNLKSWMAERVSNETTAPAKEINEDAVYHVGGGVSAPKLVFSTEPEFPPGHTEKNFSGSCLISFVVNASGLPEQLKVVRSLGSDFDQSALDAVKQYRFEPAMFGGKPVPVGLKIEVAFKRF
jgi:TonB family protein